MNSNIESGCKSCGSYSSLQNLTNYSCDQYCLCRHTQERSTKDRMDFDFYVLGKPVEYQKKDYSAEYKKAPSCNSK